MEWDLWGALVLVLGTSVQAIDALIELRRTKRPALEIWTTEDELARREPWWRRRQARRMMRQVRSPETARDLRHVNRALFAWSALFTGAVLALVHVVSS